MLLKFFSLNLILIITALCSNLFHLWICQISFFSLLTSVSVIELTYNVEIQDRSCIINRISAGRIKNEAVIEFIREQFRVYTSNLTDQLSDHTSVNYGSYLRLAFFRSFYFGVTNVKVYRLSLIKITYGLKLIIYFLRIRVSKD